MGLFDGLEEAAHEHTDVPVMRAPFGYVGSKLKSVKHILPKLPQRKTYIEVFGGSGVVLLNRRPSTLDVYNDRFGGVVSFYRCLKNAQKLEALIDWLEHTVAAKEEYLWCRDTWKDCTDDVERAARWYYSVAYSFGFKGAAWGRTVTSSSMAGQIRRRLEQYPAIHKRLENVQIENASWETILKDYDHPKAVFYLDPPYIATDCGAYSHAMTHDDHRRMLETVMDMQGFVAVSGFPNALYESYDWDDRITWNLTCTLGGNSNNEKNHKEHLKGLEEYGQSEEVLWVKEAR